MPDPVERAEAKASDPPGPSARYGAGTRPLQMAFCNVTSSTLASGVTADGLGQRIPAAGRVAARSPGSSGSSAAHHVRARLGVHPEFEREAVAHMHRAAVGRGVALRTQFQHGAPAAAWAGHAGRLPRWPKLPRRSAKSVISTT